MADALRDQLGVNARTTSGDPGEFSVLVDGQIAIRKGLNLPRIEEVLDAVRRA